MKHDILYFDKMMILLPVAFKNHYDDLFSHIIKNVLFVFKLRLKYRYVIIMYMVKNKIKTTINHVFFVFLRLYVLIKRPITVVQN